MNNTTTFRTLSLSFNLPLHPSQLDAWQYAFQQWAGWQAEEVAAYPLIQYRIWKGQATVYAVNDGVEQLQAVLAQQDWSINWQGEERQLLIEDLFMNEHHFKVLPLLKSYQLLQWVAFEPAENEQWEACYNLATKAAFLEEKLKAALHHFFEAVGYQPAEEPVVYLQEIRRVESLPWEGQDIKAFKVVYQSNIDLPAATALGHRQYIEKGLGAQHALRARRESAAAYK
jgi:hypothetical protein